MCFLSSVFFSAWEVSFFELVSFVFLSSLFASSLFSFCDDKMPELKISLPEELKQEMEEFPNIEWQAVVRRLLKQELDRLLELKSIVSKSKLTERDIAELSNEVD